MSRKYDPYPQWLIKYKSAENRDIHFDCKDVKNVVLHETELLVRIWKCEKYYCNVKNQRGRKTSLKILSNVKEYLKNSNEYTYEALSEHISQMIA